MLNKTLGKRVCRSISSRGGGTHGPRVALGGAQGWVGPNGPGKPWGEPAREEMLEPNSFFKIKAIKQIFVFIRIESNTINF